jgi:hypothetical protein
VDKAIKAIENSGYSGYVSGIGTAAYNNVGYISFNYKGGKSVFLTKIAAVNNKVQQIVATQTQDNMSEYDKELSLHDYLATNTKYDYDNAIKNTIPDDSFTAYGALITGTAVCEGYAEAMYKLLSQAKITAYIINGYGNGVAHEWNLVNIQGGLYHLDATFDSPVSTSGKVITHNYFNVNDAEISKDHTWDSSYYPKTYAVAANYFVINNLMANNKSKYYEIIKQQLINKNPVITIRTSAYEPTSYSADELMKVLKDNLNIDYVDTSKGYTFSYDEASCVIEINVAYK